MSVLRQAARESSAAVRTVFGNTNLRRIMLAFGGSLIGDWGYATATARAGACSPSSPCRRSSERRHAEGG